ncbi:hypothetical protein PT2222_280121 [Paraburkholderia tropica]
MMRRIKKARPFGQAFFTNATSAALLRHARVPQFAAQDLADVALRQIGAELDELRTLVARELRLAVVEHVLVGERRILLDDIELHRFARMLIGHAHGRHFEHARQLRDHVLDFVRINVEARHQNHVLLAVDELDIATRIHHADVARLEVAVGGHDLRRFFRTLPVTRHHLRSANADLARFADRQFVAVVVANRDFRGRQRQPDRARVLGGRGRVAGHARRCFGQPITFDNRRLRALVPALRNRFLHRHAAAVRDQQMREVELVEIGMIENRVIERVDRRERRNRIAVQFLDHARDVARIRNQDREAARAHRQQAADGEREHVIERQRRDRDRLHAGRQTRERGLGPRRRLQDVGDQIAVQQRRALRYAGRAARVLKERDVVGLLLDGLEALARAGRERGLERHVTGQTPRGHHLLHAAHDEIDDEALRRAEQIAHRRDHDVLHARLRDHGLERVGEVLEDDDRFGAAVLELMLELARRVKRIDVHDHVARAQDRGERDRILQHVGHHDGDARAGRDAARLEPGGEPLRQLVELSVGDGLAHAGERGLRAIRVETLREQRRDGRVLARVDLGGHARRVRFQPDLFHAASPPLYFRMVVLKNGS